MKKFCFILLSLLAAGALIFFCVRVSGRENKEKVMRIALNQTAIELVVGDSQTLTAKITPKNIENTVVTWQSSEHDVATVDENGKVTAFGAGTATITATVGEKSAACTVEVYKEIESIALNKSELEIASGSDETLEALILPEDASFKIVVWESSDTNIATVSDEGTVTAVAEGTATITATAGGKNATCAVTVYIAVDEIILNKSESELTIDYEETLNAVINPANATNKTVVWESSDTDIATVDENGKITALKLGTATITATAGEKSAACTVTVVPFVEVTGITLDLTNVQMKAGYYQQLTATISPDNATDKTVKWSSSDSSVVTVSKDGKIIPLGVGTATVTAQVGEYSATCTVEVLVTPVESVTLDKTELSLLTGESESLEATVNPDTATYKTVTWASSNTGIATVDECGKVTAVAEGTVTITAKAESKSATCKVTITDPFIKVESITLNKTELELYLGDAETLTATVLPVDATDKTVIWQTSDAAVATVNNSGIITAVGGGTAVITAIAGEKIATCPVEVIAPTSGLLYTINADRASYSCIGASDKTVKGIIIAREYNGLPVTSVGKFDFHSELLSIIIPNSVTSIDNYAFMYCDKLKEIDIPDSVKEIGDGVFDNTAYYKDDNNWEDGVLYIGNHLIKAKATIPAHYSVKEGTVTICNGAFTNCTALSSITLPNKAISIGKNAFDNTEYYKDSNNWKNGALYIGNHLISVERSFHGAFSVRAGTLTISDNAFALCTNITDIFIPSEVLFIGKYAFESFSVENVTVAYGNPVYHTDGNCLIETSVKTLVLGCGSSIIPADGSVTSIGYSAFEGCDFNNITIPNGVTYIGESAFRRCMNLTSITLPEGVAVIAANAFNACYSLRNIALPDSLKYIGISAFLDTEYYDTSSNWQSGVLYIGKYLIEAKENIRGSYSVKAGTLLIAQYAFNGCSQLTILTLPDSVVYICNEAFGWCENLKAVTLSGSLAYIDSEAFDVCYEITEFIFNGTIAQWKNIEKGYGWAAGNDYIITCTDGKLDKNGNPIA